MFKKYGVILAVVLIFTSIFTLGLRPDSMTHLTSLWVGSQTATGTPTPGDNDIHATGRITMGTADLAETIRKSVQLGSVFVENSNDIDDASAPNLTAADGVPVILWDDSSETAAVYFNWAPSANYQDDMQLEVLVSSSVATGASIALDWSVAVNGDDVGFASALAQTGTAGSSSTLDASCERYVMTLSSAADTAIDAITDGQSIVTIALWNSAITGSTGTTEIKAITILEPML